MKKELHPNKNLPTPSEVILIHCTMKKKDDFLPFLRTSFIMVEKTPFPFKVMRGDHNCMIMTSPFLG